MSTVGRVKVGHPVDVASGAVFTEMVDFAFNGVVALNWRRLYATDLDINSWLGRGWTVPWFSSLERVPEGYLLRDESGRLLLFPADPAVDLPVGGSIMNYGANMELVRRSNRLLVNHWHHGTDDVERFCFPLNGSRLMHLAWLEDVPGHRILVDYDRQGRPVRLLQEAEERRFEISYGAGDLIASVAQVMDDGSRRGLVYYEYDGRRRLVAALNVNGDRTEYEYDGQDRLVRETNSLGSSFSFRYDSQNRCVHSFGDGGYLERRLHYIPAPPSTRVIDSQGHETTYFFNAAGQVIQQVSPTGAVSATDYDEFGRPLRMRDSRGGMTQYEYDTGGNCSAVIHPDGAKTKTRYNEFHLLSQYIAPSGATWTYTYNSRGEVIGLRTPAGNQYEAIRSDEGFIVETRMPSGRRIRFRYGPAFRWVEVLDNISLLTRTEFDESGNQTAIYDAQGLVQRATFDALNRAIRLDDGVGRVYEMSWNSQNERIELSGPGIPWERRIYDRFGQIIEHVNPLGSLRCEYDTEGRLVRVMNRAGDQLIWEYDADGRLTKEVGFDGRTEQFEYNGSTIVHTKSDGRHLSISYDPFGFVVKRAPSDRPATELTYDIDGNLVTATNGDSTLQLEYDLDGRVSAEVQNGRRVEYAYDGDGDRIGRRLVDVPHQSLQLIRDARKRLVGIADPTGVSMELSWDTINRVTEKRFGGTVVEQSTYDDRGRLTAQLVRGFGALQLVDRRYEYDNDDCLVLRTESNQGQTIFRHDEIGRLAFASHNNRNVESYTYDGNSAITSTHRGERVVGPGGAVLRDGPREYEYGADGSVRRISAPEGALVLEHDFDGRVTKAVSSDGEETTYGYDALGRRVYKEVRGARTAFLWEGPVLAAEFVNDAPVASHYFFAFEPLVRWSGGDRLMPVTDVSGMVREVFDERAHALWQGSFDVYGNVIAQAGSIVQNIRFRGQYFDTETGLHYNFSRTYDPRSGDYLARDPIGVEGGTHFYLYPRNPYLWDDPFGLSCAAHTAEKSMDGYFGAKGYKKIGGCGKNLNANGIDGVYYKKGGNPPYIIAEAKSNGARLGQDKYGNQQMSDKWINQGPGKNPPSRLERAFPEGSPYPGRIEDASSKGQVGKVVYNPDRPVTPATSGPEVYRGPQVQQTGTYNGSTSPTTTF